MDSQHPSHLQLDFAAEQGRLTVNGFELYPNSDPFANILVAPQVAEKPEHKKQHNKHHKDGDDHDGKALNSHHRFRPDFLDGKPHAVEQQLGFSLQVQPVTETTDPKLELIVVDLQIIEVGSVFVDGLANVRVHLFKLPENNLLIGQIEQTPSENKASAPGAECTTIFCQWRAMIAAQFAKMKMHSCAGMLGHKAGGPAGAHHGQHPESGHMGQHQSGHMDHHHHHRHSHGWALLFRKLTSHIVLPVLVGIVAGVTVSILGMIVGTLLVGLWRTFVRGQSFFPSHTCRRFGRSSHRHHKASHHTEAALVEEKAALIESQESDELPPPPAYKDDEVVEAEHVERV